MSRPIPFSSFQGHQTRLHPCTYVHPLTLHRTLDQPSIYLRDSVERSAVSRPQTPPQLLSGAPHRAAKKFIRVRPRAKHNKKVGPGWADFGDSNQTLEFLSLALPFSPSTYHLLHSSPLLFRATQTPFSMSPNLPTSSSTASDDKEQYADHHLEKPVDVDVKDAGLAGHFATDEHGNSLIHLDPKAEAALRWKVRPLSSLFSTAGKKMKFDSDLISISVWMFI